MQTEKHNNGQRAPTEVPKTRQHHKRSTKTVLGCQKTNGINLRSANNNNNSTGLKIQTCVVNIIYTK